MKDDTISRSALIAELECFKVACGDVVIRVIVDRIIGIVKAHPGLVEPEPETEPETEQSEERWCSDCVHFDLGLLEEPCRSCVDHDKWVAVG
jgi:hypothetical protein